MSSKKRKNENGKEDKNENKHPGGPLQRTGKSSDSWNEAVGSSLEIIPTSTLPTARTILRRYRYLRLTDETATTNELVNQIVVEVTQIWNRARIPICNEKNRRIHVKSVITWWNNSSKYPPEKRMESDF